MFHLSIQKLRAYNMDKNFVFIITNIELKLNMELKL